MSRIERLARISLNSADADALASFYQRAFGFFCISSSVKKIRALGLGQTRLDIAEVGATARRYPAYVPAFSSAFQHFAIATVDMAASMRRLETTPGWKEISTSGPQQLPLSSGGVVAFKFRDPEGHPLELISFPPSENGRLKEFSQSWIDHSAISVASTDRSIAFYHNIGLTTGSRHMNRGMEQSRLDAVDDAEVEVTSLRLPSDKRPHVELLCYRSAVVPDDKFALDDIAATRLVFTVASAIALKSIRATLDDHVLSTKAEGGRLLVGDPDGHILQFEIE